MMKIPLFNPAGKKNEDRPKIRPEMAPADWLMELLALAGLALLAGYAVYWYRFLPDTIPTHFSAGGKVDGYGSKGSLFMLPAIGLFIYALLTLVSLVPHTFNFPGKITPQNALRQYRLAIRLIRVLKIVLVFLFFFIVMMIVRSAMNARLDQTIFLLPVMLGLTFIPIVVYMVLAGKK